MSDLDDYEDVLDALRGLHDAELAAAERQSRSREPFRRRVAVPVSVVLVVAVVVAVVVVANWLPANKIAGTSPSPTTPTSPPPASSATLPPGRTATPTLSAAPSVESSPSAPVDAPVIARIAFPFPGAQTPGEKGVAFVAGSFWIVDDRENHLVRIDASTNAVTASVAIEPSSLLAGDGRLWTLSPTDMTPSGGKVKLSRVDLATGEVRATDFPLAQAAGLGSLWAVSHDAGLVEIDPSNGCIGRRWANVTGARVEVGCQLLWISGHDGENLTAFDAATGRLGTPIAAADGVSRVHETASGCYVLRGSTGSQTIAAISPGGVVTESPLFGNPVHIAGDTFWTSTISGILQQVDPVSGAAISGRWQLPTQDLPTNPKFADWRLISDGVDVYLLSASALTHLDVENRTRANISCQPYGNTAVPIPFSFVPGPVTAITAQHTATAFIRSCAATPDPSSITGTITALKSSVKTSTGEPSGPNAEQAVWLVQIDTTETADGATYEVDYRVEVNQLTGVPTLIATAWGTLIGQGSAP